MLICQDGSRNRNRKENEAKKRRGIEVKLGRRTADTYKKTKVTSRCMSCLTFLTSRWYSSRTAFVAPPSSHTTQSSAAVPCTSTTPLSTSPSILVSQTSSSSTLVSRTSTV